MCPENKYFLILKYIQTQKISNSSISNSPMSSSFQEELIWLLNIFGLCFSMDLHVLGFINTEKTVLQNICLSVYKSGCLFLTAVPQNINKLNLIKLYIQLLLFCNTFIKRSNAWIFLKFHIQLIVVIYLMLIMFFCKSPTWRQCCAALFIIIAISIWRIKTRNLLTFQIP